MRVLTSCRTSPLRWQYTIYTYACERAFMSEFVNLFASSLRPFFQCCCDKLMPYVWSIVKSLITRLLWQERWETFFLFSMVHSDKQRLSLSTIGFVQCWRLWSCMRGHQLWRQLMSDCMLLRDKEGCVAISLVWKADFQNRLVLLVYSECLAALTLKSVVVHDPVV